MQITLGTHYDMSGRNHLKKNQNTPRPSEHPRVIKDKSKYYNDISTCTEDVQYI